MQKATSANAKEILIFDFGTVVTSLLSLEFLVGNIARVSREYSFNKCDGSRKTNVRVSSISN